ncbi:MAG: type II toxin-antitoxin system RelE/ParE family toxin [Patescibacteria group bacterium]
MQLEFAPLAQVDLEIIGDYIALDSPGNALRFIQGLRAQCHKICQAPLVYVARPELGDGLRSCAHKRYVIFFRPTADLVRIERILHSAMDLSGQFAADADVGGN